MAAILCLVGGPWASAADKVDPTGTWTWSFTTQDGTTINSSLKLKSEGGKWVGSVTGRNGTETAIQNAAITGDEIAFLLVRERDGNTIKTRYSGKISGDAIRGKMETDRDGQTRTRDWEAKRQGAKAAADVTGSWKYSFTTSGGQTLEPTLRLKQDGEKVTGVVIIGENERAIQDGKISGGEITFKVTRERDGETFTTKYNARLEGEQLRGKIQSNWGGTQRTYDLEAKRVKE